MIREVESLKLGVLTSRDIRHRYFARTLACRFNVVAVGYQDTEYQPSNPAQWTLDAETEALLKYHFEERTRVEQQYFGHDADWIGDGDSIKCLADRSEQSRDREVEDSPWRKEASSDKQSRDRIEDPPWRKEAGSDYQSRALKEARSDRQSRDRIEDPPWRKGAGSHAISVRHLNVKTLNTHDTLNWLSECKVNAVAVFGTSLIKPPLLEAYSGRMINMHLGLSPYYRGTATNFYPLVNGEPEYVGATIHLIDPGIDTGPILHHARPTIAPDDMPHTLGCKAILAGIEKMTLALHELRTGRLKPVPQWKVPNAKVYFRKDYHPSQVGQLYRHIENGLFRNGSRPEKSAQSQLQLVD